jgi:hypothetical protein
MTSLRPARTSPLDPQPLRERGRLSLTAPPIPIGQSLRREGEPGSRGLSGAGRAGR